MVNLRLRLAILAGKLVAAGSRLFNIGAGSTWSGEIALKIEPRIIRKIIREFRKFGGVILIAGTNGKTTTVKMIRTLLEDDPLRGLRPRIILSNESGANLLNGIAGALIGQISLIRLIRPTGREEKKIGVFEVDEATLPLALEEFTPKVVVILNLFRDQLDRYGEVNIVASKWLKALKKLPKETVVVLNADDPQVAYLGKDLRTKVRYFGMKSYKSYKFYRTYKRGDLWGDSLYCPRCGQRLNFKELYFSHLGDWQCLKCGLKQPKLDIEASKLKMPLPGRFNLYNGAAAILAAQKMRRIGPIGRISQILREFKPAFGRQEEIIIKGRKRVRILLSKNPTGFNENLRVLGKMRDVGGVLLILNDRIPDGRDVSWIWDVDFKALVRRKWKIIVSGDRAEDMGLRIKYAKTRVRDVGDVRVVKDLKEVIREGVKGLKGQDEVLYILPTYSAMLEVRKILLGRKIL